MAVIQFKKGNLEEMMGKKLKKEIYNYKIPMFGCPLEKIEGDTLHFEISPNRPDILSIEGFSRAIKNFTSKKTKLSKYKVHKGSYELKIDKSVKDVRPEIVCAVIEDVKITDNLVKSLMQVQEKLHKTLGRDRKKVAIGIHDTKNIEQPFTYKAVRPDEISFIPLEMENEMTLNEICDKHPKGIEYGEILEKHDKWPIIVDKNENVLSFPPIINGKLTKITKKTGNLFIDVTGTDGIAVEQALNILVTSFADRGFKVVGVKLKGGEKKVTPDLNRWDMKLDLDYVNKTLGLELSKKNTSELLKKMDIGFKKNTASIPAYRTDIMHQMDLVEDIAIAYGYDKFETRVAKVPTLGKPLEKNKFYNTVKQIMIGIGFQEVVNLTLSNKEDEFEKMNRETIEVAETLNAVTPECNICRRDILPSLMDVLSQNQHYEYPQRIFEVGDVVILNKKSETGAKNVKKIGCAVADNRISYENISSLLDSLMENMGIKYELKETKDPTFIEGRVANIFVKDTLVGIVGEIHPIVLENWNMNMPVSGLEMDLDKIRSIL